ncbi:hypothetical protein BC835DRAFT_488690 [Cytidiella melzeri]|nr:hypothetical protein BC835DRAFT_488690 [Cytidiella melzeri]
MVEMGEDAALILEEYIHLLYEAAGIACQYQTGADGRTIAILDRRGWLHSSIFDACSDPEESWKYWVKAISHFSLVDPATSLPFPAPLPRSALPALPTPALQAVFFDWQRNIHSEVHKKKTDENAENARRRTAAYGFESNNDTASAGAMGGGYMPVNFDGPQGNVGDFYGKFIDPVTSRPSGVYTRLVDSFFFWIDSNCDIPGLRNTGFIEPAKCAWIIVKMGSDAVAAQLVVECLQSLYESAGIPCQYQRGDDGQMIAVLDRRGWLHSSIFDTCADPEETWKYWSKAVTLFALVDPATSLPFPSPLPRSAFPTLPIPALQRIYTNWKLQTQVDVQKKKTDKIVRDTMAAYGLQSAVPSSSMVASSYVGGVGATNGGLYNSGAGTGTSAANMNSTIKTVATLATTALGLFGGGGAYTYGN